MTRAAFGHGLAGSGPRAPRSIAGHARRGCRSRSCAQRGELRRTRVRRSSRRRPRSASSSRLRRRFSSAARACSAFRPPMMPTSSFTFSSSRSIGSRSSLHRCSCHRDLCHWIGRFPASDPWLGPVAEVKFARSLHRCTRRVRRLTASDHAIHRLLDLGVGQRAIRRPERQAERQAAPALGDALALVAIELADRDQGVGRRDRMVPRTSSAGKASSTMIDRSRTTDGNRGSGLHLEVASPAPARAAPRDRAPPRRRRRRRASRALGRDGRQDWPSTPSTRPPARHARPAPGDEPRRRRPARRRAAAGERGADLLDDALHVEEVHGSASAAQ